MTVFTAFTIPLSLRIETKVTSSVSSHCPTRLAISPAKPKKNVSSAPNKGKRVPTYRKLQTRHQEGPAAFREKQNASSSDASASDQNSSADKDSSVKHQKRQHRKLNAVALRDLRVGQQFCGKVRNTVRHGAYVDIGAKRDGLVHIRDMSTDFVHEVEDVLRPKNSVTVWIKYVDPVSDVLGLTMVRPAFGFDDRIPVSDIAIGSRYEGVVQRVTNYGAYIDIGAERMGFVHVLDLWGKRRRETLQFLRIGQKIHVSVRDVDGVRSHIQLVARGSRSAPLKSNVPVFEDKTTNRFGVDINRVDNDEVRSLALRRAGEEITNDYTTSGIEVGEDTGHSLDDIEAGNEFESETEALANTSSEVDEDDDDDDAEFDFADEMSKDWTKSDEAKDIAGLLDEDTEYVGLSAEDIDLLQTLKASLTE